MPRKRAYPALGVSMILAVTALIGYPQLAKKATLASRPECPEGGAWTRVFAPDARDTHPYGTLTKGEVPLSGITTDIVEFHDCQQFIVEDSTTHSLRYSSLFAIFARANLDSAYVPLRRDAVVFDSLTWGVPMATILGYDSSYARLGIRPGFNCLYFVRQKPAMPAAWRARVVPVGKSPELCLRPLPPTATLGKELTVSTVAPVGGAPDDSPPVARWDWDEVNRLQYIGIRCGTAWCEVHPDMDTGHTFASSPQLTGLSHNSKGWYDEQLLAVAGAAPGARAKVSGIKAAFVPAERLGNESADPKVSHFADQWMPVGNVIIRSNPGGYTSKLNLINAGETAAENDVSLCYSTSALTNKCFSPTNVGTATSPACGSTGWYGRVGHRPGSGRTFSYFCVIRRAHDMAGMPPAPHIPGVVRWRWMLDDETIWVRCLQGCCEVRPHL